MTKNEYFSSSVIFLVISIQAACGVDLRCGVPGRVTDGAPVEVTQSSYHIGQEVTYKCDYSETTKIRSCETTGKWSPMGTACAECPDKFALNKDFGKCYFFPKQRNTFNDGEKFCAALGAVIAFPATLEENAFLSSFINYNTFIGITDRVQEGTWMTVTGEAIPFTKWNRGEPNNAGRGGEDCVEMGGNGLWNDRNCARGELYFVCQKTKVTLRHCLDFLDNCPQLFDANPNVCTEDPSYAENNCRFTCGMCSPMATPACNIDTPGAEDGDQQVLTRGMAYTFSCPAGTVAVSGRKVRGCTASGYLSGQPLECATDCPGDWTISLTHSHCYKLFDTPKNYADAQTHCANLTGTLTTASDEEEQAFVSSLKGSRNIIWLGLSDSVTEGTFLWIDGALLSYTNWKSREPNNAGEEDCATMLTDGKWNDKSCLATAKYMCKVSIENFEEFAWFWSVLRSGVSALEYIFG